MSGLPEGWVEVSISDVAEVNPRKDVTLGPKDLVSFVPMAAVDEVSGTIAAPIDRPYGEVAKGFTHFRDGDVIFAKITPSMENGKSAVAEGLTNATGMGSTEFHVFRPSGALGAEYLWRLVRQKSFRENAQAVMSGAVGQQRVPADWLREHPIPLPPLAEQRRIVAKVDGLTARTARARAELNRIPTLIARHKQRLLALAFSGELTAGWRSSNDRQSDDWREAVLSELATVGTGATPKRGTSEYYDGGTIPWVTSGVVNDDIVNSADQKITKTALRETNCKVFPAGTLIVAMYGEGKTRGKVAVLGIDAATNQALAAIQLTSDSVSSSFVFWFFKSNYLQLREQAAGGVQPNLSIGLIKQLSIPIPSKEEQSEIVRRIEAAFGWLDRMAADHAAAARLLPKLDAAILAKAFRGELLPQDPNDEPASALLVRIAAERDGEAEKPKRGRPKVQPIEAEGISTGPAQVGTPTLTVNRTRPGKTAMTKSRQDDDVMGKPYLAGKLKGLSTANVQSLFRAADLPVADFYKQLAWEIGAGHIVDSPKELKAA